MLLLTRIVGPALALAVSAGHALAATRIPLSEAHRKAIASTRIVGNLAQLQMASVSSTQFIPGGLAGSIIAGYVNEHRAREAREAAATLEQALEGYDPRPRIQAALERELGTHELFRGAKVEVEREGALAAERVRALAAAGGADAVLVLDVKYGLSIGLDYLVVSARATLLPTATAADPGLQKALRASTRELPVTPLYQAVLMSSLPGPGEAEVVASWAAERGAAARLAIEGGIVEVVRMLAWDLEQGGPSSTGLFASYSVPREAKVDLPQFGEDFEAAPTQTRGDRVWYRSRNGELVSMGDTYPGVEVAAFAPPPPAAVPAPVAPVADASGRLTFGFAGHDRTLQGGAVGMTQYSERAGDVELSRNRFAEGVLVVSGQIGLRKGSSYAGLGPHWNLQDAAAPIDARKFQSVTFRLGSTTRVLRLRLNGKLPPGADPACEPVYFLEDVEEPVKEYTVPLARFAAEGWCGRKGRSVAEVLPELVGFEVVSNRITSKPLTISVGATTLNP